MGSSSADLAALATALAELAQRVTAHAEAAQQRGDDETAVELFAVERSLGGAARRLARVTAPTRRR